VATAIISDFEALVETSAFKSIAQNMKASVTAAATSAPRHGPVFP
jgi:hypothetical protein